MNDSGAVGTFRHFYHGGSVTVPTRRRQLFEGRLTGLLAQSDSNLALACVVALEVVRHTRMRFLIDYHTGFE